MLCVMAHSSTSQHGTVMVYACGVQESGQVECWGKQGYDQGWGMANGFNKTNGDVVPPWAGFDASLAKMHSVYGRLGNWQASTRR